jgi:hypothetical protein
MKILRFRDVLVEPQKPWWNMINPYTKPLCSSWFMIIFPHMVSNCHFGWLNSIFSLRVIIRQNTAIEFPWIPQKWTTIVAGKGDTRAGSRKFQGVRDPPFLGPGVDWRETQQPTSGFIMDIIGYEISMMSIFFAGPLYLVSPSPRHFHRKLWPLNTVSAVAPRLTNDFGRRDRFSTLRESIKGIN